MSERKLKLQNGSTITFIDSGEANYRSNDMKENSTTILREALSVIVTAVSMRTGSSVIGHLSKRGITIECVVPPYYIHKDTGLHEHYRIMSSKLAIEVAERAAKRQPDYADKILFSIEQLKETIK